MIVTTMQVTIYLLNRILSHFLTLSFETKLVRSRVKNETKFEAILLLEPYSSKLFLIFLKKNNKSL